MKQGKVWGTTTQILVTPFCEVHHIDVVPYSHCSKHHHKHKYNLFYVIKGELIINTWKTNPNEPDETLLQAGQWTVVKPGDIHQFIARDKGCEALEVYFPEGIGEDIIRETIGGKDGGWVVGPNVRFKSSDKPIPGGITIVEEIPE